MVTKKTLKIEIGVTAKEIQELILAHLLKNNEEFAKIHDGDSKPQFEFMCNDDNDVFVVEGCNVILSKTK
jgi:hypothetical protein